MKVSWLHIIILFFLTVPSQASEMTAVKVKTAKVAEGTAASTTDIVGTLYFERVSRVAAEEGARVRQVTFKEGDTVTSGDILVKLDTQILEQQLALENARLNQVDLRIENAKRDLDRMTHLFKNNVATESAWDDLRLKHEELLQEKTVLERQRDILKIRMEKTVIRAPFNGLILKKNVEVGTWAGPGLVLCVLAASDALFVQVPVAEEIVGFTRKGDRLTVFLNAFDRHLTGIMTGIRPVADPRTKNVSLKLKLEYDGPVAENMSAIVQVPVSDPETVLMVPRDALVQYQGTDMVYVIREKKAKSIVVKIVHAKGNMVGVKAAGLSAGETVAVEGNERLRPGQIVEISGE